MDLISDKVISTSLSVAIIGYVIVAKVSELNFRKRAIPVTGKVIRRFPRQHYTSYYVAYHRAGLQGVAEYCGPPVRMLFEEGDTIEILIDPEHPPDTRVPGNVSSAGSASGNCSLLNEPIFHAWDFVYLAAALGLLVYTCWQ